MKIGVSLSQELVEFADAEAEVVERFARVLAVEHASTRRFPAGSVSRTFEDTGITVFRL